MKKSFSLPIAFLLIAFVLCPALAESFTLTPGPETTPDAGYPAEPVSTPLPFASDTEAIEAAADSCYLLRVYNDSFESPITTAAGFCMFGSNIIVTNRHILEYGTRLTAESDDGVLYEAAGVLVADPDTDLALIAFNLSVGTPLAPSADTPRRGDPVAAIGSPLGYKNIISFGNIGGVTETETRKELLFTAPISSGSSGGALFNAAGEVIGVTAEIRLSDYAQEAQSLNVAVDIAHAVALYADLPANAPVYPFSDLESALPSAGFTATPTPTPAPMPTARPVSLDFDALRKKWPDVKAWLRIADTVIDYPVVQAEDNIYYLNHLPNGDDSSSGALFIDCGNAGDFSDDATSIHGHHLKSGKMFGSLEKYLEEQYYYEHPVVELCTPKGDYDCAVFAACYVDADTFSYPQTFLDAADYDSFVMELKAATPYDTGITPCSGERLLILSTCAYVTDNARFLIACVMNPDRA